MAAPPNNEENQSTNRPQRFQKMVRRNGGTPKKGSSSRNTKGYDCCHKCGKPGHFIKHCPFLKQEHYKHNSDKVAKKKLVPDKRFSRKSAADNVISYRLRLVHDLSIYERSATIRARDRKTTATIEKRERSNRDIRKGVAIRNIEKEVGQIAKILSERVPGTLPADTERNPKEIVNVVTLRSGQVLKDPTLKQKDVILEKESVEQLKNDVDKKKKGQMKAEKKNKRETSRREEHDVSEHCLP
ncbi:uncharacterized protein [Nicotiana sylvestris]|uniref:uncharacterized protein n=1 Tax=Nicotiana sylvestris TaxID=4096 RepID=UPI00388CE709